MSVNIITVIAPSYWASALANNDWSGLSKEDVLELTEWLDKNQDLVSCMCCSDDPFNAYYNGVLCEMLEYTFAVGTK